MKTITVVITETANPFPDVGPWPLVYTVHVEDPDSEEEIRRQVALIRCEELCLAPDDDPDGVMLAEIIEGIEVHFTFEGDLSPLSDFRV